MSVFDQEDDNKDYLAELTGPGGKFDKTKYASDQEMYQAIAKSNVHGSRTIAQRNTEFDELRESYLAKSAEADAAAKLDELIKKYETRGNDGTTNNQNVGDVNQPQELDPKKIEEIVAKKLQEIEVARKENDNMNVVDARLREVYGDNASQILKEKMNTLGISNEDLKFLAKKSPEAVFNALGLNQQRESFTPVPRGNTRSDNFKPETTIRDAVYWEKLRNESPKEYFSQKNSVQRLQDMENPDFLKRYNDRRT